MSALAEPVPDPLVIPVGDFFLGVALEVHALDGLGPLAEEGEAVLGVGVDEFVELRGASVRMPNQANGYSRKYRLPFAFGIRDRQWL